ncbi:MAG TPA: lysophospholipase [Burkholderiaceae bacterium]|nr:lysophospholipase [Burkholderiaceae bacterium]
MSTLTTSDGLKLQLREWPCDGARGTVLIVHGLGEHLGRYEHVAAQLLRGGWHVVGYDQRGHGASEGPRGRLHHPDDLLRDLALVIDAVRVRLRGPLLLLGHSMGGLVAARMVAAGLDDTRPPKWHRAVDALVLSSPALDLGLGGAQKLLLALLGRIAPNFAVGNGLKPEWISRDPAVVEAYVDDPLVHDRVAPKLVRFIVDGGAFVRAHAARWRVPTLLIYAGNDRCVAPAGSAAFAAAAPVDVVSTQAFPALYHEIFNEPEQASVFAVLGAWLARVPSRPGR